MSKNTLNWQPRSIDEQDRPYLYKAYFLNMIVLLEVIKTKAVLEEHSMKLATWATKDSRYFCQWNPMYGLCVFKKPTWIEYEPPNT